MSRDAIETILVKITELLRDDEQDALEKACRALLRQAPDDLATLSRLGVLLLESKRFKLAVPVWQHLSERDPDDQRICLNLAKSYLYANKRESAVAAFQRAATLCGLHQTQAPRRPVRQVSVVMASFNRAHLLERSLEMYARQTLPDFELVILDDASTDNTFELVKAWQDRLDIKYLHVKKAPGCAWRDAGSVINLGLRTAFGEVIVCTHPEVMPGRRSLEALYAARRDFCYLSCKNYALTGEQQQRLDGLDWKDDLLAVRTLPGFYEDKSLGEQYSARAIERARTVEEWVFGAMTRRTWQWIGGFRESAVWGACDVTFNLRRAFLGIETVTMQEEDTYCVHQNHDNARVDVLTPRDVRACTREVPVYRSQSEALEGNLW
jgi:tetratricopeptide (TPR) repeat protein